MIQGILHTHITSWILAIMLFFLAIGLRKYGKSTAANIVHMAIRFFYVFILISGLSILFLYGNITLFVIIKAIAGLWVIGSLEILLVKSSKNEAVTGPWVQFLASFALVLYLGFSLPL